MSVGAVQAVYWAVTALMGVSLSLLLFTYTGASVARTFFVTAAAFGALSLYGYTTKRDLTAVGKFLFMGVIGLILASLVNMIWPSGTMSFVISAAGVLIFSGLIAYDTQKIKERFAGAWGTDAQEKIAIFSALSLYINFVNLFQFLMMFHGPEALVPVRQAPIVACPAFFLLRRQAQDPVYDGSRQSERTGDC